MTIVLGSPRLEAVGERLIYRVSVDGGPGPRELWFSVPLEFASFLNARADAAAVAMLMPAMAQGDALVVEGPLTDELHWYLVGEVQSVLRGVRPELSPAEIAARQSDGPHGRGMGIATGYSAGVDSYATLGRHHFAEDVPDSLRVTHLLYNNVGSHGHGDRGRELYRHRLELLRPNALSTGLPLLDIDSNIDDFYVAVGLAFQPSHTMRNAAVVHLLSSGIRQYLYASSVPFNRVTVTSEVDIGFSDPVLLPLLSTQSVTLRSSCSDLDRSAKTALIAEIPHTYERLDVCVNSTDGTNCSECWKCHRTMLTLDLLGKLDLYRGVFRTPRNPNWREAHILHALTQDLPSAASIVGLYDDRVGITPGMRARARAHVTRTAVSRFAERALRYAGRRMPKIDRT